jgi:hypothetical protein
MIRIELIKLGVDKNKIYYQVLDHWWTKKHLTNRDKKNSANLFNVKCFTLGRYIWSRRIQLTSTQLHLLK